MDSDSTVNQIKMNLQQWIQWSQGQKVDLSLTEDPDDEYRGSGRID